MFNFIFIIAFFLISSEYSHSSETVPNIVGTWVGENKTLSEQRGFRTWEKNRWYKKLFWSNSSRQSDNNLGSI